MFSSCFRLLKTCIKHVKKPYKISFLNCKILIAEHIILSFVEYIISRFDDNMIDLPAPECEADSVVVERGQNIKPIPKGVAPAEDLSCSLILKVGDNNHRPHNARGSKDTSLSLNIDGSDTAVLISPRGERIELVLALTERQRKILLAGGLLNYTSHNAE